MAAMSTTLTEFSTNGNSRTFTTPGHTAVKPKLIIQRRKVPTSEQGVVDTVYQVVHATTDATGAVLARKVLLSANVNHPVQGQASDVTAALAIFRELVASDEFGASVTSQNFIG